MTKIPLNDLPEWSPWPARLLGHAPWTIPDRTVAKVDSEYDKDKYGKCLAFFENSSGSATPETVKQFEFQETPETRVCLARGNELELASLREARSWFYELLRSTMAAAIEHAESVVELGCGYGINLWTLARHFPAKRFYGGEYSANAVRLAGRLYEKNASIQVQSLNFYDTAYPVLEGIDGPVIVFTAHAIEQLPSAARVVATLLRYRTKIARVFHFEPVCELHDHSLLGLMRRRYAAVNDYNRDLLGQLQKHGDKIRILRTVPDVLGINPFNPTSIIEWQFLDT